MPRVWVSDWDRRHVVWTVAGLLALGVYMVWVVFRVVGGSWNGRTYKSFAERHVFFLFTCDRIESLCGCVEEHEQETTYYNNSYETC